jgi:hypothetical protein
VSFSGASELVAALAASQEARACYSAKWLAFALGHELAAEDEPALAGLAAAPLSVRDLLAAIAESKSMRARWPNEVAP